MSEFEDQLNEGTFPDEGLGELPEHVRPGERDAYQKNVEEPPQGKGGILPADVPQYIPPDMATEEIARQRGYGDAGETLSGVTSTYKTRPIHARDFYHKDWVDMNNNDLVVSTEYTSPDGFITVLNSFKFCPLILVEFDGTDYNTAGSSNPSNELFFVGTFYLNGSPIPEYSDMKLYQYATDPINTHIIAGQGDTIKFELKCNNNLWNSVVVNFLGINEANFIEMEMYGQNLLSRGMNLPFEISTQNIGNY